MRLGHGNPADGFLPMPRRRYRRPTSVSVVCYVLIFRGAMELLTVVLATFSPPKEPGMPPISEIFIVEIAIDAVLSLVFAVFMLRGANWARIGFYIFSVLIAFALLTTQFSSQAVLAVLKLAVCGAFLATSRASRFFTGRDASRNRPDLDVPAEERLTTHRGRSRSRSHRYDY
jgi:hypothetical protein